MRITPISNCRIRRLLIISSTPILTQTTWRKLNYQEALFLLTRKMVVGNGENFKEDTEEIIKEDPDETSMVRHLDES